MHKDAKKSQAGEAKPWSQPSAVAMGKASEADYKAGNAPMVGGDAQHNQIHKGPEAGEKSKASGHNSDFEGMRY